MKDKNQDRPPPQPLLDHIETFHRAHEKLLAAAGYLHPFAVIFRGGDIKEILATAFFEENDMSDKDQFAEAMRQRCSRHDADAVCLMTEAYARTMDKGEERGAGAVKDMPGRVEIVMYNLETRQGRWMGQAVITGKEGAPRTLAKIRWMGPSGASSGRFTGMLPTIYATPDQVMAYLAKAQRMLRELGVDPERKFATKSLTEILAEQFRQAPADRLTDAMLESFVKKIKIAYDYVDRDQE